jgi:hypothetical protein
MKVQTIPRLELTAATVAVKVACMVVREFRMQLDIFYHTDSMVVLHYIRSSDKHLPLFVANRVNLIRDFSDVRQWRYVPSEFNPADAASRGLKAGEVRDSCWLQGPEFFRSDGTEWPAQPEFSADSHASTSTRAATSDSATQNPTERLLSYFASWTKTKRVVAIYRKLGAVLINRIRKKKDPTVDEISMPVTAAEISDAEGAILRWIQRNSFGDELERLMDSKGEVTNASRLGALCPFIDSSGLIWVGGRF